MARMSKKQRRNDEDLIARVRRRFKSMLDADEENRRDAMRDFKFIYVPGAQWDEHQKTDRGRRPCYEFNQIRVTAKRISNDLRASRPAGKILAVEDTDKDTADVIEGLIRNIWNQSSGDSVVDYAAEYQVGAGMGAWRIKTDYAADDVFDQDIMLEQIDNPFCLFADPAARDSMKRDAMDWVYTDKMALEAFEQQYPDVEPVDFEEHEFDDDDEHWSGEGDDGPEVRIAEYWWKEPIKRELWQLADGRVIYADSDDAEGIDASMVKKSRVVDTHKIMMCVVTGDAVLEQPKEFPGLNHPFVQIYGEYLIIDGRIYWYGIGRFAKDAQRSYNVSRTAITETIAQAPLAKWWATTEQAKGNTKSWAEAHRKNLPFMLYNPDPKMPGPPTRMGGADVPIALIQESQLAASEIKAVTGIFDDDLGADSKAQSGRAIYARQQQGQMATFNYLDNLSKGVERTYEILLGMIPHVYDAERSIRILGKDDAEKYIRINAVEQGPDGTLVKRADLTRGRYDVVISTGPNFNTKRQEAAEIYQQLTQGNPEIFSIIGDLVFRSMDLPYSDEISERLQVLLPPEIQQMISDETDIPPEVQAMMAQAQQAMEMIEQQAQVVQQAANEAEITKTEAEKAIAEVKTEKANFQAYIAQETAKLVQKGANLKADEAQFKTSVLQAQESGIIEESRNVAAENLQQFSVSLAEQVEQAMASIAEISDKFNLQAAAAVEQIAQNSERPKIREVKAVRENGQLKAVPVYDGEE